MELPLYQADAFTDKLFSGNPACVVPLQHWLPDNMLLQIAKENAVAETAFFIMNSSSIHLRWFTPEIEMDLCGHATLATAHVLKTILQYKNDRIVFNTLSGDLTVSINNNLYTLDFPSRKPVPAVLPKIIAEALDMQPISVLKARDFVLVYNSEADIRNIRINRAIFDQINLGTGGVIITAPGNSCDFVSRFFSPQAAILEDPVTGSAHCSLIPYWSEQLNKKEMVAWQLSERGGKLFCEDHAERVFISGMARTYSMGMLWTE
jgi:PhzF family phenazine biosynthesis protein